MMNKLSRQWLFISVASVVLSACASSRNATMPLSSRGVNATPRGQDVLAKSPLSPQATAEQIWLKVIEMAKFSDGYLTKQDVEQILGVPFVYSSRDGHEYTAHSTFVGITLQYNQVTSVWEKKEKGLLLVNMKLSSSSVAVALPKKNCIKLIRARHEFITAGLHFNGSRGFTGPPLPIPPKDTFIYPDAPYGGWIFLHYSVPLALFRGVPDANAKNICVTSVNIDGLNKPIYNAQ